VSWQPPPRRRAPQRSRCQPRPCPCYGSLRVGRGRRVLTGHSPRLRIAVLQMDAMRGWGSACGGPLRREGRDRRCAWGGARVRATVVRRRAYDIDALAYHCARTLQRPAPPRRPRPLMVFRAPSIRRPSPFPTGTASSDAIPGGGARAPVGSCHPWLTGVAFVGTLPAWSLWFPSRRTSRRGCTKWPTLRNSTSLLLPLTVVAPSAAG
jgi:hypothetical protein